MRCTTLNEECIKCDFVKGDLGVQISADLSLSTPIDNKQLLHCQIIH